MQCLGILRRHLSHSRVAWPDRFSPSIPLWRFAMNRSSGSRACPDEGEEPVERSTHSSFDFNIVIKKLESEVALIKEKLKSITADTKLDFILNPKSKVMHRAAFPETELPSNTWSTLCGWAYGTCVFQRYNKTINTASNCLSCVRSFNVCSVKPPFERPGDSSDSAGEESGS